MKNVTAPRLLHGDCLEVMDDLPDASVDLILCDLPYGATACKWDSVIPFEPLWEQYRRIIRGNGAIALTACMPFTGALMMSNPAWYRHHWVYEKTKATNFVKARKMPMRYHEDVLVFSRGQPQYNPQMVVGEPYRKVQRSEVAAHGDTPVRCTRKTGSVATNSGTRFPSSIIRFQNPSGRGQLHPTQKPVDLMEYLIRTYSNEGDTVLDNCMGSGTTGVACLSTDRQFIGIEKEERYYAVACARLAEAALER